MVFSSTIFLYIFLPLTLLGYFVIPGKGKNIWLLIMSLIFFAWGQLGYLWIILLNIAVNYTGAFIIDKNRKTAKPVMLITVLINLGILYYFKYFDFTLEAIRSITHIELELQNIILPIGISFFTFQGMSYVIDVYRKEVPVQKNPLKVALYIVLFPQLIAGPIVRYKDIEKEIDNRRTTLNDFTEGVQRFIIGLSKKAIIANTMALAVDAIWTQGPAHISLTTAWFGSIAYTLQIYFDFSGYSDMAIGLGRIFGFHFNENFNLPYISKNITEFWRRWHISLSTWFRDYVYIPLGGNRKRVYLNLSIVFLLTGIWHGAAWHFILWGVWNGAFILIERVIKNRHKKSEVKTSLFRTGISKIYALAVINLGWILFRADTIKDAIDYVRVMFRLKMPVQVGFTLRWYLDNWTAFILLAGIFFASSIPTRIGAYAKAKLPAKGYDTSKYILLLLLFFFACVRVVSGTYNPFIYFQF